ncbi:MAG TPA: sugar ABC transporter substrate-binding protein [Acetobacteraceae bacterium]|jgi:sorbitol/mannitol transport system substrate-binding protein|nr:sugar ABC transporter substrate-binding protein [Acetobacteraceae bacterium]
MRSWLYTAVAAACIIGATTFAHAESITVATVNNNDMIVMQKLAAQWEQQTGNKINWVVLEENVLRQRVTTDITTGGGQFDVMTIGSYEAPIWGKQNWLLPLDDFPQSYNYNDIFKSVRDALTSSGHLWAVPFYAESSFTMYRKDLFDAAGLKMPAQPTYTDIETFAKKLTDRGKQQYGVCLRGKPGWGENMALLDTMVNTFGGRWFNDKWQAQLDTPPWHDAVTFYVDLLRNYGPPGASSNGFNENLALFTTGHCAMWIDATVAAGLVSDPKKSQVVGKVDFAPAPIAKVPNGNHWFWAWALAVPKSSHKAAVAKSFLQWATSADYIKLVAQTDGWVLVPPGTRQSTYDTPQYLAAAPFAKQVEQAIQSADLAHPTAEPVPYTGIQYVAIPEFQAIGTTVGQLMAAALTGQSTVDATLKQAQAQVTSAIQQAGYTQ